MKLNECFEKIYCLNLTRRLDRWANVQQEFNKHNIEVHRFIAADWESIFSKTEYEQRYRANIAHLTSFVNFFKLAIEQNLESVFLFEDDVCLHVDFNNLFSDYIKQVPEDWMMLYVGGNHSNGFSYTDSPNVIKCFNSLATHAIGYKKAAFETILYNLEYHLNRILAMTPPNMYTKVVGSDVWLAILQNTLPTYSFNPSLAWQSAGYSDIEMQNTDSTFLLNYKF